MFGIHLAVGSTKKWMGWYTCATPAPVSMVRGDMKLLASEQVE
jgi:hypothetical protein